MQHHATLSVFVVVINRDSQDSGQGIFFFFEKVSRLATEQKELKVLFERLS